MQVIYLRYVKKQQKFKEHTINEFNSNISIPLRDSGELWSNYFVAPIIKILYDTVMRARQTINNDFFITPNGK